MKILMAYGDANHLPERKKLNEYGGVGYYRIIKPSQEIDRSNDHEIKVIGNEIALFGSGTLEDQWADVFKQYDVFWTNYISDGPTAAAILYNAQKYGKYFIVDVDDNFLDVPSSNLLYDKFKHGKKDRAHLLAMLSLCSAITVSTEPLRDRIHDHLKRVHGIDKPIYVIPNMNDVKDWDHEPAQKDPEKIVIGYTGSNSHQDDLQMVMPALKAVMERHPNVYFETIGVVERNLIPTYFRGWNNDCLMRAGQHPSTAIFKEYPAHLASMKWDIGIAPLVDTPFTRSKSHIKWMEYSMYEIPTVASRVYPYFMELAGRPTIDDGETGLLCSTTKQWEDAFERLIGSAEERKRIGKMLAKL